MLSVSDCCLSIVDEIVSAEMFDGARRGAWGAEVKTCPGPGLGSIGGGRFEPETWLDWLAGPVDEFKGNATRLFNNLFVGVLPVAGVGVNAHFGGSFQPGSCDAWSFFCVESTSSFF